MNDTGTCDFAHLDAAYVLGALSADERLEYERHLPGCRSCSQAVQELAGLPGLLAQVSPDVLESEPDEEPVPDTLLPSLVREVRRTQHRRRWTAALVAAAAVVLVAAVSVVVVATNGDEAPPAAAPAREMTQVEQSSVWGELSMTSVDWGTRLDLTCSYEAPSGGYLDDGPPVYSLVVHTRDGATEQVASWTGLPGEPVHITGATARTTEEISYVEVRTADGQPVLSLAQSRNSR
ncbi:anti-sigma factor [Nocardioides sp. SR21]|uniref:anti-sigma factor family protein n=1 Tax=Nocardioides sp. SR21 TaxID=2919501 RepID=UPI001FA9AC66|nr:zf-HC2 domain-containing protein [Nocardioides sp. SR21]